MYCPNVLPPIVWTGDDVVVETNGVPAPGSWPQAPIVNGYRFTQAEVDAVWDDASRAQRAWLRMVATSSLDQQPVCWRRGVETVGDRLEHEIRALTTSVVPAVTGVRDEGIRLVCRHRDRRVGQATDHEYWWWMPGDLAAWVTEAAGGRAPRRARVAPTSAIERSSARGSLMGNRGGALERPDGDLKVQSSRAWIYCDLDYAGRSSANTGTSKYTKLFFRDEATALAAGHRPCGKCKKPRLAQFRSIWGDVHGRTDLVEVDRVLSEERRGEPSKQDAASLPSGVAVELDDLPYLVVPGGVRAWRHDILGRREPMPEGHVTVLTPRSIVDVIRAGFEASIAG